MLFNHFTPWPISKENLNKPFTPDWKYSRYWESKTQQREIPKIGEPAHFLQSILSSVSKDNTVENLLDSKYYAMMLKEYIFEDIRLNEFSNKPSRKNCMFLVPQTLDLKEYAKRLGFDDKLSYIEVEPLDETKIHFANFELLDCDHSDHEVKIEKARQYWKGTEKIDNKTEVLYQGEFIIRSILIL
jgi:hypothetical protein